MQRSYSTEVESATVQLYLNPKNGAKTDIAQNGAKQITEMQNP